tara:strand:+ start:924 stop:1103 length:180 start_codon:yes stop_codon:yes gene_type:complete
VNDKPRIEFSADVASLRLLRKSVAYFLEKWPGGDPQEQISLVAMRTELDKALLDLLLDK